MSGVSIDLCGGLGNQLFQIAAAYAYALRYKLPLYIVRQDRYGPRNSYWETVYQRLKDLSINESNSGKACVYYQELPEFEVKPIPSPEELRANNKIIVIRHYFQASEYFRDYKSEICKLFSCPHPKDLPLKPSSKSCAIHIRRGDYLQLQHCHYVQPLAYYQRAIAKMKELREIDTWYLVSEDYEWAKSHKLFTDLNPIYFNFADEVVDFWTLSQCAHFIIANSSYSWWAAYLGTASDKVVIAPDIWFGPSGPKVYSLREADWVYVDSRAN